MGTINCTLRNGAPSRGVWNSDIVIKTTSTSDTTEPPLLYKLSCSRKWEDVVKRCKTNPIEAKWQDGEGGTTLHAACYLLAPAEVINALLAANPTTSSCRSKQGATPLHIACLRGSSPDVVLALLKDCPPAAAMVDAGGGTPLHIACVRYGYGSAPYAVLRVLVAAYPNAVTRKDDRGRTPLSLMTDEYASTMKRGLASLEYDEYIDPIEVLHGSETNRGNELPLAQCWDKMSLLVMAAYQSMRMRTSWSQLPSNDGITRSLDLNGNFRSNEGQDCLLVHACAGVEQCPFPFLRLAIKVLAHQLSERDSDGNMPLHIAAATHSSSETEHRNLGAAAAAAARSSNSFALQEIFQAYPAAVKEAGKEDKLPLVMAMEAGRTWERGGVRSLFLAHPAALMSGDNLDVRLYPSILSLVGGTGREGSKLKKKGEGRLDRGMHAGSVDNESSIHPLSILYEIITSKPEIVSESTLLRVVERPLKGRTRTNKLSRRGDSILRHFK